MKKILLTGHTGSSNRGCEAIVRSTIGIINRSIGASEIHLLSFDKESDCQAGLNKFDNLHLHDIYQKVRKNHPLNWFLNQCDIKLIQKIIPGFSSYLSFTNRALYRAMDGVIIIGGDMLTNDYGSPSHVFGEIYLTNSFKKPIVIWAASIGPFRNSALEKYWAGRLKRVTLITVREDRSVQYLKSIGVTKNVRRVVDPAFLLEPQETEKNFFDSMQHKSLVGLGASAIISHYGLSRTKYIEALVSFGRYILSNSHNQLVIVPHVITNNHRTNDTAICQEIAFKLNDIARVKLVDKAYNSCELKYIISRCDYFVGARTHATIASLSSYVPTISVAYSAKAYGLNYDIFGHADFVLPIKDLNDRALKFKFELLLNRRIEIIEHLRRKMPELFARAEQGGVYLNDVLGPKTLIKSGIGSI